jgi:hypothetical protein
VTDSTNMSRPEAEFLLYQAEDGRTRVEVRFDGETAWLSLGQMAALFQRDKSVISRHVANVFEEGELPLEATVARSATVRREGDREVIREVDYYNLDVIISVGYRVKSHRGTQFRIWATQRLREYIVKGFTLDDERLKRAGAGNYFDELLARIRDIRSRASTTTPVSKAPGSSSRPCRTRCTGRPTAIRRPRSSPLGPTRPGRTWG